MINYFIYVLLIFFSIYAFIQVLSYAIYEIKELKNKSGGIAIIVFSLFTIILANVSIYIA